MKLAFVQWCGKPHHLVRSPFGVAYLLQPVRVPRKIYVRVDITATVEDDLRRLAKTRLRFSGRRVNPLTKC